MTLDEAHQKIAAKFGDKIAEQKGHAGDPFLMVKAEALHDLVAWLRDDADLRFNVLHCVTALDTGKTLQSVYHLDSYQNRLTVTLKVEFADRDKAEVASLTDLHSGADWLERECWDMVGIKYVGHPNLVRILCAEDWEGHPLRKDYVFPTSYHGIPNDI